ncbi:MAG: hypothetical protein N2690_11785, partial [Rhodocyclaceae bacterium]|nr:hypothetical protein [Rhodocyclaceae bacterium]
DCLGRVMRLLNSEAAARGIELVCASDPELPSQVRGDLTSLERLLFDLTAQVIAASAPGRISLRARLSGAGAKPSVRFEIQGDAIPEGGWPANPPPDPLAAVPLGIRAIRLAISKGLAERLGGELGADPLNRVIWVDLPLKTGDPLEG